MWIGCMLKIKYMLKMLTHAYTCLLCAAFLVYLVFLMLAQPSAQVSASSPEFCLSLPSISACSLSLPTAHDSWMPFHSLWCLEPMGAIMSCEWERRFWDHASSGSHSDAKTNGMIFSPSWKTSEDSYGLLNNVQPRLQVVWSSFFIAVWS